MRKISILSLSVLLLAGIATAQEPKKPLSPPASTEAKLSNGKKLSVAYSAPSMRGRKIMGELVPYGKVWRTGANAATTLTTEGDIMLGSIHVPAGTYTLFTIPGEKEWTLIVNKQTGQSGTAYDEAQDLGRTKMTVKSTKEPVETFAINATSTALTFTWENTQAIVPVTAH
jgi:hypothetical protein